MTARRVPDRGPAGRLARRSWRRPSARSSPSRAIDSVQLRAGPVAPRGAGRADRARSPPSSAAEAVLVIELTDEQRLIQETARDFVDNEVIPQGARLRPRREVRHRARAPARRDGLPRRAGRRGVRRPRARLHRLRADRRGGRAAATPRCGPCVSVQTSLVCGSIERWGTEEQKQRWLPRLTAGRGVRLLRAHRARHRLRRRQPAHAGGEDRRRLADHRRQDVDLARQRRRGRADLRPDRPREEAQGPRLLPGPDRLRRLLDPGDPRQARPAGLRHRRDLRSTGRGRRRRADGRGRRRLQGRDVGARLRAATRSPRAASGSSRAACRRRSPTRRSAGSSTSRSRASSSSRR